MDLFWVTNSSTPSTNDTAGSSKLPLIPGTIESPTHIPAIARKFPSFFKREPQENVRQSDIVIVCVFPKHNRVSVLIPTTPVLSDQLEQGRAQ